jgi:hypothetical protein
MPAQAICVGVSYLRMAAHHTEDAVKPGRLYWKSQKRSSHLKVGWNWWFFKKRRKRTHHCLDPKVLIFKVELEGMWNMNLF